MADSDLALALALQAQFDEEDAHEEVSSFIPEEFRLGSPAGKKRKVDPAAETSIIAPEWEDLDPTPDLHALFLQFNTKFFWGKLLMCEVKWSPRMTLCAGVCSYQRRSGYCSIRLSVPLLKLRPRKDLVETLLHEMIHAYLFVTDGDDDHDGHGPAFHSHMHRINKEAGTKISVYHSFHDEVALYKQHWWKCNGPCQKMPPYYGMVKRSMNRAPGPYDRWFADHQATCGGTYTKVKEPEGYGQKKSKKEPKESEVKGQRDIRSLFGAGSSQGSTSGKSSQSGSAAKSSSGSGQSSQNGAGVRGNIFGFGGTSFASPGSGGGGLKTKGRTGTMVVGSNSRMGDNSSGGKVISSGNDVSRPSSTSTSGQVESSPGAVRQTLRDIWANKFDAKSQQSQPASSTIVKPSGSTLAKPTSKPQNDPPKAKCPVCRIEIEESQINAHLDRCLESPPPEVAVQESSNPFVDDEESGKCPICGKEVLIAEMNHHLDLCIAANK